MNDIAQAAIDGVAARAETRSRASEGDYIRDGLLYCGECNTPKQCVITVCSAQRVVPCLCECEGRRRDEREAEYRRRDFLATVDRNRSEAFSSRELGRYTFEADDGADPALTRAMRIYAERYDEFSREGKGLLLYGPCGTGKTFAAMCAANALLDRGYTVLATSAPFVVNEMTGTFDKQEYIRGLNSFDLLILDDLGAERDTETAQEAVFEVIDSRWRAGKPVIVTTNLTGDQLRRPQDTARRRIYSRLLGMCHPIEVNGRDRRKSALSSSYRATRDILGI